MFIRELIQKRLNSTIRICNREGVELPESQVKKEYQSIRRYLLDFRCKSDDCIAIKLNKDYQYLLTMLACMEIGIPYIPMKHDYPKDRVEQIREDSKFTILVDDEKLEEILNYTAGTNTPLPEVSGEKDAYIIFTSGSTGRPKGVIIQRKALDNFLHCIEEEFPSVNQHDKLLQVAEFSFDQSVVDIALFLTKNVALYFSNFGNNIFKLGFEIETHRISVLNTVPNTLNMFLSDFVVERMDYSCLQHLYLGGARFSHGLYIKCLQYFNKSVDIYNLYGPTEATVYCHIKKLTYEEAADCFNGNVSIGKPFSGVTAYIVVGNRIASDNEKGELYIGGVQVMRGYRNNPEQTSKALIEFNGETFYRSGDLAFQTDKHEFFVVGRVDDTIKYRGFRINLLDIDSYITRLPYVQDSVTIALPNEITENQTIGFIILKEPKTVKEIKLDLGQLLLDYQVPEKIIFVNKYPTNTSGKVCKNTLKAQYLESLKKS